MDNNDIINFAPIIISIISILSTIIIAILSWKNHLKTEKIKIIENQLSEKKYSAYSDISSLFFNILKDVKENKISNTKDNLSKLIDIKKNILMYGSDDVFIALCEYLESSTSQNGTITIDKFLNLIVEIRKDMCGKKTKIKKQDILLLLMQNKEELKKYYENFTH